MVWQGYGLVGFLVWQVSVGIFWVWQVMSPLKGNLVTCNVHKEKIRGNREARGPGKSNNVRHAMTLPSANLPIYQFHKLSSLTGNIDFLLSKK